MYAWKQTWILYALNEALDILMIFHVGVTFSPLHEGLLTRAFNGQGAESPTTTLPAWTKLLAHGTFS
jgi:hypothetical protein